MNTNRGRRCVLTRLPRATSGRDVDRCALFAAAHARRLGLATQPSLRDHRCDLERRRPVVLLPDREQATAEAWLAGQLSIAVVARDRGGGYGGAIAKALPDAIQVAGRWHLMSNASQAFLAASRKSMREIRTAIGATTINPELLTSAERRQYETYPRREETNAAILALAETGMPIKRIARTTGYARDTVRRVVRGERSDVFQPRQSSFELSIRFELPPHFRFEGFHAISHLRRAQGVTAVEA